MYNYIEPHSSTKDKITPLYHNVTDHYSKETVEEPENYYDVIVTPGVKMMSNPSYAAP